MVFNCELVYYEPNNTVDENLYIILIFIDTLHVTGKSV